MLTLDRKIRTYRAMPHSPVRPSIDPRRRPTRNAVGDVIVATGVWFTGASGNVRLDTNGNVMLNNACPDGYALSLTFTISGVTLTPGCIFGGQVASGVSVKWDPAAAFNVSGCGQQAIACGCTYEYNIAVTTTTELVAHGTPGGPVHNDCLDHGTFPYTWNWEVVINRVSGGWNFTVSADVTDGSMSPTQVMGGSVAAANCLDPFVIANTYTSSVMSGGQIAVTPSKCSTC